MKKKTERGFTFIELLVALTIFSIMATTVAYALSSGIRLWERENSILRSSQVLRLFFNQISSDLRNAQVYQTIEPEWESDKMIFFSTSGGLLKLEYSFDPAKGELKRNGETLLKDIEKLSFQYAYRPIGPEDEVEWKESFQSEDHIPRGVKLKVTFKNEKEMVEKIIFIPSGVLGKAQ